MISSYLKHFLKLLLLALILSGCRQAEAASSQWRWQQAEAGLPRQAAIVLAVAADPLDPNRLWAGYYDSGGLTTSADGGQTWTSGAAGLADNPIFDLLPVQAARGEDPPVRLWAAARDGLLVSSDYGQSWQAASGLPAVTAFAIARDEAGRLYVGLDSAGIYAKNSDADWQAVVPADSPLAGFAVISLAVSGDGRYIYAGTSGRGIFASQDYGRTWTAAYADKYGSNIAVNPTNPLIAVAGLRDQLVKTQDGGQSWQPVASLPLKWDEVTSLLWLADGTLGVGTSQGRLHRSLDDGETWLEGGEGLPPGGILDLAITERQLLAATWNGLYSSEDGGQSWSNLAPALGNLEAHALLTVNESLYLGGGSGLFRRQPDQAQWQAVPFDFSSGVASIAAHPTRLQTLYVGTTGDGVFRSDDGGATWRQLPSRLFGVPALAIDPQEPDLVYLLAAWERVYESRNGGQKWDARWEGLGEVLETISLAVDPADSSLYVGAETGLFRAEGSQPWELVAPTLADQSILALLAQPKLETTAPDSILYLGTTRGVYRSLDRGETVEGGGGESSWGRGLENISVTALLADPGDPRHLYAGTAYHGVYQSTDGGQQWQPIGPADLSDSVIESMAWGPDGNLYIAAAGVWVGVPE